MRTELKSDSEIDSTSEAVYSFVVMRPGGNDTALIDGIIQDPAKRKQINDTIMDCYPNVEQVGFINTDPTAPELTMAGGEFCGNATRSTAWLTLGGKSGEVAIKVSGVQEKLRAGVTSDGETFAQMPIYRDTAKITDDGDNRIVEMEGITQYINFNTNEIEGLSQDEIKQKAMALIRAKNLDRFAAAGVMYSKKDGDNWSIVPIVYVKAVDTLYAETACGSGTTALGLVLALQQGKSIKNIPIIQPTGLPIKVSVEFDGTSFGYAQISGPVEKLAEGTLIQKDEFSYAVEQITHPKDLESALDIGGLTSLYNEIFGEAPYFESFTEAEILDIFEEYRRNGILLLTKNQNAILGFSAAVPLDNVPDIEQIIDAKSEQYDKCWYIADLGVKKEFRRNAIGKKLTSDTLSNIQALGGTIVYLRTSINNIIALSLYRKLGFLPVSGATQEVTGLRISGTQETDTRLFLSKKL